MEVFNKIYSQVSSSVSSTVSQLSGVLPGNPVTREFDAIEHIASGGPGLLWKVYRGVKKSTKQEASIFVLEKRQLENYHKADREIILELFRRGVMQLTKIRHPQILTVQHPLEESRESLAFATEPVFASLANILGDFRNMPQAHQVAEYKFYDVEIKYGLLQLGEGLAFLHNDVKLLHKNISPETVIVNHQGAWKIFGFDFCVHNVSAPNNAPHYPLDEFTPSLPQVAQPNLNYLAPECVLSQAQSTSSDMFALGMVAYALHSANHQCLQPVRDVQQFRGRANLLKTLPISKLSIVPDALRECIKLLLHFTPDLRPDAHQFVRIPYFDDVGVMTLRNLDSLLQLDNLQKSQFYKGLPEPLAKLPQRVRLQRVFPCLCRDLSQPAMVPFVLPNIMDIAQHCEKTEFVKYILPSLKPVMRLTEPVQILLIFLQRMELLLKLTPVEDVQQHVLPMLYRGLDSDTPQIHELCLTIIPTFAGLLDHANVKNHLIPRIKKLCLGTNNLSVRVNSLLCIGRLLEHLDRWLVIDDILPFLPKIPSREPAVLMGILGIYKLTITHKKLGISKEVMATRVLPFLIPLCIENGLSLAQFNALVSLVKQMFQMVENEHRTKLEQLNTVQQERKALEATMMDINVTNATNEDSLHSAFNGLGLDSFAAASPTPAKNQNTAKSSNSDKLYQNHIPLQAIPASPLTNNAKEISPLQVKPSYSVNFGSTLPAFNNFASGNPCGGINKHVVSPSMSMPSMPASQNLDAMTNKNWSALDNLMSMQSGSNSNNKRMPMNQMMNAGGMQPMTLATPLSPMSSTHSSAVGASKTCRLTNDDIMDLLN